MGEMRKGIVNYKTERMGKCEGEETTHITNTKRKKDRRTISEATKKKHSKEKWVDKWQKMVYNTVFETKEKSSLATFMNQDTHIEVL